MRPHLEFCGGSFSLWPLASAAYVMVQYTTRMSRKQSDSKHEFDEWLKQPVYIRPSATHVQDRSIVIVYRVSANMNWSSTRDDLPGCLYTRRTGRETPQRVVVRRQRLVVLSLSRTTTADHRRHIAVATHRDILNIK